MVLLRDEQDGQQRDGCHAAVVGNAEQHAQRDEQRHGAHHPEGRKGKEPQIEIGEQRPDCRARNPKQPGAQRLAQARGLQHHHGRRTGQHRPHAARSPMEGARHKHPRQIGQDNPGTACRHHRGPNPAERGPEIKSHTPRIVCPHRCASRNGPKRRETIRSSRGPRCGKPLLPHRENNGSRPLCKGTGAAYRRGAGRHSTTTSSVKIHLPGRPLCFARSRT